MRGTKLILKECKAAAITDLLYLVIKLHKGTVHKEPDALCAT